MAAQNIHKKDFMLGLFKDPDQLMNTVHQLRDKGVHIYDAYTPFPVHGLDIAIGVKRSRLVIGAFICGLIGASLGFLLLAYMNTSVLGSFKSWPMNIGGKPSDINMFPSMIPIIFECTILFTAFGMSFLFFARSRMVHGIEEDLLDIRQTDDVLVLAIESNQQGSVSKNEIGDILTNGGAFEVKEQIGEKEENDEH